MGTCSFPREKRVWLSFNFLNQVALGGKGLGSPNQVAHKTFLFPRQLDYDFQVFQVFQIPFSPRTSLPNSSEKVTQWMNVVCSLILQLVIDMVQFFFQFLNWCATFHALCNFSSICNISQQKVEKRLHNMDEKLKTCAI
jgi:hypothetical protein